MNPQAGWYQDPGKPPGHLRYWNGSRWTDHESVPSRAATTSPAGGMSTSWVRRHKLASTVIALVVLGWTVDAAAGVDQDADRGSASGAGTADRPDDTDAVQDKGGASASGQDARETKAGKASSTDKTRNQKTTGKPSSKRKPPPVREPRTYLVARVIDGDTVELGNGSDVRVVGIDTPEVGQCGYDAATNNMARLVLNKQVRLTISDEDTDHYGRWLRYVNVGRVDVGLQQIRQGFAIARYDSRDGYGFHVREPRYIAADRGSKGVPCPKPAPAPLSSSGGAGACAPGYTPCVPPFPPDVDCADVDGPISVTGVDPHGLDADGDGAACE